MILDIPELIVKHSSVLLWETLSGHPVEYVPSLLSAPAHQNAWFYAVTSSSMHLSIHGTGGGKKPILSKWIFFKSLSIMVATKHCISLSSWSADSLAQAAPPPRAVAVAALIWYIRWSEVKHSLRWIFPETLIQWVFRPISELSTWRALSFLSCWGGRSQLINFSIIIVKYLS